MTKLEWIKQTFGDFQFEEINNSKGEPTGFVKIGGDWVKDNIISSEFENKFGKLKLWYNAKLTQLIENIFDEVLKFEEKINRCMIDRKDFNTSGGCFCARHQSFKVRNPLSYHSWGIAIDCNTVDSMRKAWQPPELITIFNKYGFEWGGKWNSWRDFMHWEIKMGEL